MSDITSLKFIGDKTAEVLLRLGISSIEDLILNYPRDYDEFAAPIEIFKLKAGEIAAIECVLSSDASINRYNGLVIVNVNIADMTGRIQLSWYNTPYLKKTLKAGSHFVFRGRVYFKNNRLIMSQPKIYRPEDYKKGYQGRLMPIYRLKSGISNNTLIKAQVEAQKSDAFLSLSEDFLSEGLLSEYGLIDQKSALSRIHFPKNREELSAALRRLSFDEFFFFLLLSKERKKLSMEKPSAFRCKPDLRLIKMTAELPFELTKDQSKALKDIQRDLCSGKVMNRLIEGDVGSGKTIVAMLSMAIAAFSGYEAALMAPTEVLARQHYEKLCELIRSQDLPLRAELLCGSMTKTEKERVYKLAKAHECDLIIGTHALFQEKAVYDKLGLIVTDEQHRFGVEQREAMKNKSELPHMLFMSATPIPRTLSMVLYGDMDVSVIEGRPVGRLPVKNAVVGIDYRARAYKFIEGEVKKGNRAYVICPAIDEEEEGSLSASISGGTQLENIADYEKKLREALPENINIGILHGKMKPSEKDKAMQDFKEGKTQVLLATTVVEVGVDVPEATVMMIENADRFGLSQLHQLRGRVGRGSAQSYCIMVNTSEKPEAAERLNILKSSNDGFYIAKEDLRLRGPGELFGIRQSGDMGFRLADIYRDAELLKSAERLAALVTDNSGVLNQAERARLNEMLSLYNDKSYYV